MKKLEMVDLWGLTFEDSLSEIIKHINTQISHSAGFDNLTTDLFNLPIPSMHLHSYNHNPREFRTQFRLHIEFGKPSLKEPIRFLISIIGTRNFNNYTLSFVRLESKILDESGPKYILHSLVYPHETNSLYVTDSSLVRANFSRYGNIGLIDVMKAFCRAFFVNTLSEYWKTPDQIEISNPRFSETCSPDETKEILEDFFENILELNHAHRRNKQLNLF